MPSARTRRTAFLPWPADLPAGYPRAEEYDAAVGELSDAGFRILEIGIPPLLPGWTEGSSRKPWLLLHGRHGDQERSCPWRQGCFPRGMAAIGMLYHATVKKWAWLRAWSSSWNTAFMPSSCPTCQARSGSSMRRSQLPGIEPVVHPAGCG